VSERAQKNNHFETASD